MSENKVKRNYMIAGVLFGVYAILMLVYRVLNYIDWRPHISFVDFLVRSVGNWPIIPTICGSVLLALYSCLFRNKKTIGTVMFCLALLLLFIIDLLAVLITMFQYYEYSSDVGWSIRTLILIILICAALVIARFRKEKIIILLSTVLVVIYTVHRLYTLAPQIYYLAIHLPDRVDNVRLWARLVQYISDAVLAAALVYLWWLEGGHRIVDTIKKKRQTKQQFATLETSLRSLKAQFESDSITQEDYDEKRKELLSQL